MCGWECTRLGREALALWCFIILLVAVSVGWNDCDTTAREDVDGLIWCQPGTETVIALIVTSLACGTTLLYMALYSKILCPTDSCRRRYGFCLLLPRVGSVGGGAWVEDAEYAEDVKQHLQTPTLIAFLLAIALLPPLIQGALLYATFPVFPDILSPTDARYIHWQPGATWRSAKALKTILLSTSIWGFITSLFWLNCLCCKRKCSTPSTPTAIAPTAPSEPVALPSPLTSIDIKDPDTIHPSSDINYSDSISISSAGKIPGALIDIKYPDPLPPSLNDAGAQLTSIDIKCPDPLKPLPPSLNTAGAQLTYPLSPSSAGKPKGEKSKGEKTKGEKTKGEKIKGGGGGGGGGVVRGRLLDEYLPGELTDLVFVYVYGHDCRPDDTIIVSEVIIQSQLCNPFGAIIVPEPTPRDPHDWMLRICCNMSPVNQLDLRRARVDDGRGLIITAPDRCYGWLRWLRSACMVASFALVMLTLTTLERASVGANSSNGFQMDSLVSDGWLAQEQFTFAAVPGCAHDESRSLLEQLVLHGTINVTNTLSYGLGCRRAQTDNRYTYNYGIIFWLIGWTTTWFCFNFIMEFLYGFYKLIRCDVCLRCESALDHCCQRKCDVRLGYLSPITSPFIAATMTFFFTAIATIIITREIRQAPFQTWCAPYSNLFDQNGKRLQTQDQFCTVDLSGANYTTMANVAVVAADCFGVSLSDSHLPKAMYILLQPSINTWRILNGVLQQMRQYLSAAMALSLAPLLLVNPRHIIVPPPRPPLSKI